MSAELARFDTRRTVQNDESSEQIDFRAVGAREQGQLALDELGKTEPVKAQGLSTTEEIPRQGKTGLTRRDLEVVLGCACDDRSSSRASRAARSRTRRLRQQMEREIYEHN